MTATPPPTDGTGDPLGYDPADGLSLLHQSRDQVIADHQLDYGPWWYPPILAFAFPAFYTWAWVGGPFGRAIGLIGAVSLLLVLFHDRHRRKVRPHWVSPSERNRIGNIVGLTTNFFVISGWVSGSRLARDEGVVDWVIIVVGYIATLLVLTIARSVMHRELARMTGA